MVSKMISDTGKSLLLSLSDIALTGADAHSDMFIQKLNSALLNTEKYISNAEEVVNSLRRTGDILFERIVALADCGARTPDVIKEAMGTWAQLSTEIEKYGIRHG